MKYQLIIVGGGPAGYTAAEAAGAAGLSVLLIEKNNIGGVCLNEGCIPTKTLLYSAKIHDNAKRASKYAVTVPSVSFDLPKMVARKNKVVRKLVLGIKNKLSACHVTTLIGEAFIVDKNTVCVADELYQCDHLMLCTGSETVFPPINGIEDVDFWTHRDALDAKELPHSLTIIGGGVIGMEFASYFNSLGTKVTVIEMMDEILTGMDRELSAYLRQEYAKRGVQFYLESKVTSLMQNEEGIHVAYEKEDSTGVALSEKLLICVGRRPVMADNGIKQLHLEQTEHGNIVVNEQMQTSVPGVYVCGDLTGHSLLAHTAVREAEVAVHSILGKDDSMSYRAIPGVVYTNPEFAGVGQTEETLQAKGILYNTINIPMAYSGRFVAENEGVNGYCKLLIGEDKRMLGAQVLGNPASEIITIAGRDIELQMTVTDFEKIVVPHPTVGEIFREAL